MKNDKLIDSYIKIINESNESVKAECEALIARLNDVNSKMLRSDWKEIQKLINNDEIKNEDYIRTLNTYLNQYIRSKSCPMCMTNSDCDYKIKNRCVNTALCPNQFKIK